MAAARLVKSLIGSSRRAHSSSWRSLVALGSSSRRRKHRPRRHLGAALGSRQCRRSHRGIAARRRHHRRRHRRSLGVGASSSMASARRKTQALRIGSALISLVRWRREAHNVALGLSRKRHRLIGAAHRHQRRSALMALGWRQLGAQRIARRSAARHLGGARRWPRIAAAAYAAAASFGISVNALIALAASQQHRHQHRRRRRGIAAHSAAWRSLSTLFVVAHHQRGAAASRRIVRRRPETRRPRALGIIGSMARGRARRRSSMAAPSSPHRHLWQHRGGGSAHQHQHRRPHRARSAAAYRSCSSAARHRGAALFIFIISGLIGNIGAQRISASSWRTAALRHQRRRRRRIAGSASALGAASAALGGSARNGGISGLIGGAHRSARRSALWRQYGAASSCRRLGVIIARLISAHRGIIARRRHSALGIAGA